MQTEWTTTLQSILRTEAQAKNLKERVETFGKRFLKWENEFGELETVMGRIVEELKKLDMEICPGNSVMCESVVTHMNSYCQDAIELCELWGMKAKLSENKVADFMMLTSKFKTLLELLPFALQIPTDDLFSISSTDDRWTRVKSRVTILMPENPEELERGIRKMAQGLMYGNAVVSKGFECADVRTKEVVIGAGTVLYRLSPKKMSTQAKLNYAKPSLDSMLALWNMADSVLMAPLLERGLEDVALTKMIYIPRTTDSISPFEEGDPTAQSTDAGFISEPKE